MMSPAWSSRMALLSSAILALAVVWLLVRTMWLLLGGVSVPSAPPLTVPQVSQSIGATGDFRWNLFGRSTARPVVPVAVAAADTRLSLKGVVAGDRGYAIIADPDTGEQVYRVGDPLPGGGELERIESRRVIIARDARRETLALDPDAAGQSPSAARGPSRQAAASSRPSLPGVRGFNAPSGAGIASLPPEARSLGLDASELASAISVMPVAGGGFRVRPGRNARLFSQLGLEVNDVVLAVNGRELESAQAVRGLFADIMTRGEVVIRVRRGERELTLRPDLEQIMGSLQAQ